MSSSGSHRHGHTPPRAVWLVAALVAGCGYPEVGPGCYAYAKALYAVANRRQADRVEPVCAQVAEARESEELNDREAGYLDAICDDCRAGRWGAAAQQARAILEAQTHR